MLTLMLDSRFKTLKLISFSLLWAWGDHC
jgi:hypothetical protein